MAGALRGGGNTAEQPGVAGMESLLMQKHPEIFLTPDWDPIPGSVLGCPSGPFPPFCPHGLATGIPKAGPFPLLWPLIWVAWTGHNSLHSPGAGDTQGDQG